jgi:penicillin-insensitive murein endopeptidase
MSQRFLAVAFLLAGVLASLAVKAHETMPAKVLFGNVARPSRDGSAAALGTYAKGCLRGAVALPADGPGWVVMRPSRNRAWAHPRLIDYVERLAAMAPREGWPGLLVGDMAQPRGGPMVTGHASHQIGLDVDIWLTPLPQGGVSATERETRSAVSMLSAGSLAADPARLSRPAMALIRRAALFPEVDRLFVHPGIKQVLCDWAGDDRAWLSKVRPWWGHDTHVHVRLRCPEGDEGCVGQPPPPPGDGCGDELAWWFTDEPWRPKVPPSPPAPPLTLDDLPGACRAVLSAP